MKCLIFLLCIGYGINSYGQTDKPITKGNMLLGGSVGFSYTTYKDEFVFTDMNGNSFPQTFEEKVTSISFTPLVGYFVSDGLAIGVAPTFSYYHEKYSSNTYSGYAVGIAPFIKAYFNNGLFVSLQSGLNYQTTTSGSSKYSATEFYVNPSLGYAFFINPKVSIEPSVGYLYNKTINKQNVNITTLTINSKIFFSIGFQIFL